MTGYAPRPLQGRHWRWRRYRRPVGGIAYLPDTTRGRDCDGCADCDVPPPERPSAPPGPGAVWHDGRIEPIDPPLYGEPVMELR